MSWETIPLTVTLTIETDGHTFHWPKSSTVHGARYAGATPPPGCERSTLERRLRDRVDELVDAVRNDAAEFLARAYPYAGEPGEGKP